MTDNDPRVLARELRKLMTLTEGGVIINRVADYLESLSAPVEDEEKVCREILASAMGEHNTHRIGTGMFSLSDRAALSAMREYARRLRAPVGVTVGEPAASGLEVTDETCITAINAQMSVFARQDYEASGRYSQRNISQVPVENRAALIDAMRAALTAALQANGVSGSPSSPIQTSELEEAGNGRGLR